jgi:xylulokinase
MQEGETMEGPFLAGIDVGTTSVKAALFSPGGRAVRSWSSRYPTARPRPGHVEQDPADWMACVISALENLTEGLPSGAIAAVGLCSQVNTHVFVGADGQALMPAIVWQDGRCAVEAATLDPSVSEADRLKWWGAPLPIDASHVLARIEWVRRHRPDVWARTSYVMAPKDFCILSLTGEAAADPLSSFGVIDGNLHYIGELLALVPGAARTLPPLLPVTGMVGRIRPGMPGAGLPVINATMDAWTGLVGSGVCRDGDGVYLSGTSEVAAIVSRKKVPTPGVIAFPECEGIVLHAGPTQAGGASVEWLARMLGRTPEEISEFAARASLARPAPVFLPHLQGERAPIWDIDARASISGLDGSMGAPEIARAVLEGVAYSVRLLLESLEQSSACSPQTLRIAGGGAASDVWCQIRADVLGRRLERLETLDSGVLGAAMLAGIGQGMFRDIAAASAAMVRTAARFEPDPAQAARHAEGYARYRDLYVRLKGFNRQG